MTTTLTQIEACLNSRPIMALTQDPEDYVLTPGHFLVHGPLLTHPEPSLLDIGDNRLSRWQYSQKLYQQFWRQWSDEYLSSLQQRTKWVLEQRNAQEGDIVLIREENLPPTRWLKGRIIKVHRGADGLVRVADIKTEKSIFRRAVSQTVWLPTN